VPGEYILAYVWTAIVLEPHPCNRQFISYGGYQTMQNLYFGSREWHPEDDRLNLHISRLPFRLNTQGIPSGSHTSCCFHCSFQRANNLYPLATHVRTAPPITSAQSQQLRVPTAHGDCHGPELKSSR